VDLKGATWTIRERKRDGEHLIFLSRPAARLLKARRNGSAYVFPSPSRRDRPIRQHALVWAIVNARRSCPLAHWTAHDIRRSSATLLQSQGVRVEVVRRILGHYSMCNPTDIYARHGFDIEARAAWMKLGALLSKWAPT
jgi:integrase